MRPFGSAEDTASNTYYISSGNLSTLRERLDKIVAKSNKLGVGNVSYVVGRPVMMPFVRTETDGGVSYHMIKPDDFRFDQAMTEAQSGQSARYKLLSAYPVTVTGTVPRLAGWKFVATLQHLKDDQNNTINLLRIVPGYDKQIPKEYRNRDASNCDHCCRVNTRRKDTFLVENEQSGSIKQVGRQCVQDFLGGKDPKEVAAFLEGLLTIRAIAGEVEAGSGYGGRSEEVHPILGFLTRIAAIVRVDGFVSRAKSRESGLKATVDYYFYLTELPPRNDYDRKVWNENNERTASTPDDVALAEKALDYARTVLSNRFDLNDYEHNLYVATTQPFVTSKTAGITASLIPYYTRELGRQVERQRQERVAAESEYFGTVGERIDLYVTLERMTPIETFYGTTRIHRFATREGNIATWFASSDPGMEVGKEYFISGTVKEHKPYQNVKQTVLTRVSVYTEEALAKLEEKKAKAAEKEAKKAEREAQKAAKERAKEAKEAAKAAKAASKGLSGIYPEAVEHYIANDPISFALALQQEYGIPTVAVCVYLETADGHQMRVIEHVAGELPDGRLVDAAGIAHPEDVLDELEDFSEHDKDDVVAMRVEPFAPVSSGLSGFGYGGSSAVQTAREYVRSVFGAGR